MELKEQPFAPTLARKLGDVPHVSGLLRRLAQLSGAGERVAEWLLKVAIARGANHYRRDFDPTLPPDLPAIGDEEIGVALCLGQSLTSKKVVPRFLHSLFGAGAVGFDSVGDIFFSNFALGSGVISSSGF